MMKRIIFLDVDGVLNYIGTTAHAPDGSLGVSSGKTDLLKTIVKETNASIVLSSSWRRLPEYDSSYKYLIRQLNYKGLSIIDKTPFLDNHRGKEIRQWLDNHKEVEQFVILDDEFIMEFEECGLSEHLVHTELTDGLTKEDVKKAIQILNGEFDYVSCRFSKDGLRFLQGILGMCEVKKLYSQDQSYYQSKDLRHKIGLLLSENKPTNEKNHIGRKLN